MVLSQIMARGISDTAIIEAMLRVPRHLFIGNTYKAQAYEDHPVPIGKFQTISQPYIVAYMLDKLNLKASHKVLDIGSGCGYQTAVLAEICSQVYAIEIIDELAKLCRKNLDKTGYKNVQCKNDDGYLGWKEKAPFDAIIVAAASNKVPEPLLAQLKTFASLIMPIGKKNKTQQLIKYTNTPDGIVQEKLIAVRFVPFSRHIHH